MSWDYSTSRLNAIGATLPHTHTHTHHSLQKFKLNLANTVISHENASLLSMNTSELLDLFQLSETPEATKTETGGTRAKEGRETMKSVLESMPELWSEDQYHSEYDLSSFMQSLSVVKK